MEPEELAKVCKALGDPTRARIFHFLLGCCCPVAIGSQGEVSPAQGPTVGEVCCQVAGAPKATSTVSFHLKELREAGLITMEKRGRHLLCGVDRDTVAALAEHFGTLAQQCSPSC